MLSLRPMQENAFAAYRAFCVEEYAKEMSVTFDIPLEKAHQVT